MNNSQENGLQPSTDHRKLLGIAASAGGLAAISTILNFLPEDLPVIIVIVQHLSPLFESHMAEILSRRTKLKVKQAEAGEIANISTVYIAPPDHHLLVTPDGKLNLSHSPAVHFLRPSADILFQSMATSFKERAIGLILTGNGSDGSIGIAEIKKMGGTIIVQNHDEAQFGGMPSSAMHTGLVDYELLLDEIGPAIVSIVNTGVFNKNR